MRALVLIVLVGLSGQADAQECEPTFGHRVMELLNVLRAEHGLGLLSVDPRLVTAAQRHSEDMAAGRFLEHEGSDGSTVLSRIEQTGYEWMTVSENIAAGQPLPDSVVAAWMRSPVHRSNILDASMMNVGIGYAVSSDEFRHYWTADFGASRARPQVIVSGCHP